MSKEQFDLYLSLVRKFLKLNSSQIASLSDELADHYHTRCEDLIADGHSIYDAEKLAIEELGDATQLAHQLSTLKHEQQRKWIMRTSLTGLTFFAVACLIFSVMWAPDGRLSTPQSTLAQNESNKNSSTNSSATVTETKSDQGLSRGRTMIDDVEKKLNQQINIDFIDAPLKEVLGEISKLISLDIILDEQSFEEIGISMDAPLTVSLKHSKLPVRDVFKLINRKLGSGVYINVKAENGYASVYVSSEPDMTVKVYDVSDLLKIAAENDPQMQWNKTVDNNNNNNNNSLYSEVNVTSPKIRVAARLIIALQNADSGTWFVKDGVGGTIDEFDGKLVVKGTQEQHLKIEEVLKLVHAPVKMSPK